MIIKHLLKMSLDSGWCLSELTWLINHLAQAAHRAFVPRVQLVKCVGTVITEATHLMIYTVSVSRF